MATDEPLPARFRSEDLEVGVVAAVEVEGCDFVVWRGTSGTIGTAPRWCPHLDHDLTEGYVVRDELVCAGHGWAFDGCGRTFKRNELGRIDPKGDVETLIVSEHDSVVEVERRPT